MMDVRQGIRGTPSFQQNMKSANNTIPAPSEVVTKMPATSSKTSRIAALDFTKGALVLIMVLYHWINYFLGGQDQRYLRFLTPSFIFITGFIISNVYLAKYGISDPHLPRRLIERGLRILGIFVLLNITRSFFISGSSQEQIPVSQSAIKSFLDIYIIGSGAGNGQTKVVAFFILIPISYLLILSALILVMTKFYRHAFHVATIFIFLCIVAMDFRGLKSPNLEALAVGLLGVIAGYLPVERVNALVRHPYLLALGYVLYLGAITVWNVIYPLQIIGVYLSLMILYLLGQQNGKPGKARECILLLGKYSLLGYIAQIAILQILRRTLTYTDSEVLILGLSFVLAFALTILSVEIVDRMRAVSTVIDKLYRAVFA